jgi:hypothetical protein
MSKPADRDARSILIFFTTYTAFAGTLLYYVGVWLLR